MALTVGGRPEVTIPQIQSTIQSLCHTYTTLSKMVPTVNSHILLLGYYHQHHNNQTFFPTFVPPPFPMLISYKYQTNRVALFHTVMDLEILL